MVIFTSHRVISKYEKSVGMAVREEICSILFSPNAELIVLLSCLLAMSVMAESEDESSCNAFEITQISLSYTQAS